MALPASLRCVGDNAVVSGAVGLNPVAAFECIQLAVGGGITLYQVGALDCSQQCRHNLLPERK